MAPASRTGTGVGIKHGGAAAGWTIFVDLKKRSNIVGQNEYAIYFISPHGVRTDAPTVTAMDKDKAVSRARAYFWDSGISGPAHRTLYHCTTCANSLGELCSASDAPRKGKYHCDTCANSLGEHCSAEVEHRAVFRGLDVPVGTQLLGYWSVEAGATGPSMARNILKDWQGNKTLGTIEIVSSWATPKSSVSSRMYAVRVRTAEGDFVGRSAGKGMAVTGKLAKA